MKPKKKDKGPSVPSYIVTFSDMVTLLLTFFVLLISLANVQDESLFNIGRDSFRKAIISFGLVGFSYGKIDNPDFGNIKVKWLVDSQKEQEQFDGRIIDARQERARRLFKKLTASMKTIPSQIVPTDRQTNFAIADIHFADGAAELNDSAKQFLATFSSGMQENFGSTAVTLYVVGLAPLAASGPASEQQQYILSAQRAHAVVTFLNEISPPQSNWRIYSWGAGPGGDWALTTGTSTQQSHILIAVL